MSMMHMAQSSRIQLATHDPAPLWLDRKPPPLAHAPRLAGVPARQGPAGQSARHAASGELETAGAACRINVDNNW